MFKALNKTPECVTVSTDFEKVNVSQVVVI